MLASMHLEELVNERQSMKQHRTHDPGSFLRAASEEKLVSTIVSAKMLEGKDINTDWAAWHKRSIEQSERYLQLEELVRTAVNGKVTVLKGRSIGTLYPSGWDREAADLDLVVSDLEACVSVGRTLEDYGWACRSVSFFVDADELNVAIEMVELAQPRPRLSDLIQIQTPGYFSGKSATAPVGRSSEIERLSAAERGWLELLGIVADHGRIKGRDVLDFYVLFENVPWENVRREAHQLGLLPEWIRVSEVLCHVWPGLSSRAALQLNSIEDHVIDAAMALRRERTYRIKALTPSERFIAGEILRGQINFQSPRIETFEVRIEESDVILSTPFGQVKSYR